jgi:hypothetical protein
MREKARKGSERDIDAELRNLLASCEVSKPTAEGIRALIEGRKQTETEFLKRIFQYPGVPDAIQDLQRRQLPGHTILQQLVRLALAIQSFFQQPSRKPHRTGRIGFPSSREARRALSFSKRILKVASEVERFQRTSLPPELLLYLFRWKTEADRDSETEKVRRIPGALKEYADFLEVVAALQRPPRGRRSHDALDTLTRKLVQDILGTMEKGLISPYGVLTALAVLVEASYAVAGHPRRISPKTLQRLLAENRT